MSDPVVRIAARGDGVTASGAYVPFGVPGDVLREDGSLQRGSGYQLPPCRHFPECGGCQLQHVADSAYADYLIQRVAGALAQQGIETEILPPHISPPRTRRRATLRALHTRTGVKIGFHAGRSNQIVDMHECHILLPELFNLIAPLRTLLRELVPPSRSAQVHFTAADQGVDLSLAIDREPEGFEAIQSIVDFATEQRLARLTLDSGHGPETRYEPEPATITLGGVSVSLPPGAFLQATREGEQVLVNSVLAGVGGAKRSADLFAGLGTFTSALPGQVTAIEAARAPLMALASASARAGRNVSAVHRDLYRAPLDAGELKPFEAVVLDPPRAGAAEQVRLLAASSVPQVVYVSCNPATFAVDAASLVAGGYRLLWAKPVGQFRWSTHVELAAAFER